MLGGVLDNNVIPQDRKILSYTTIGITNNSTVGMNRRVYPALAHNVNEVFVFGEQNENIWTNQPRTFNGSTVRTIATTGSETSYGSACNVDNFI